MSDINESQVCGVDGCIAVPDKSRLLTQDSKPAHLQIDILSDAICPWCYVAKRHLEMVISNLLPYFEVHIRWHPFQLNPAMPLEGMDRRVYRTAKFDSWERSLRLDAEAAQAGREVGLEFHHERIDRTPNTLHAHRLIWLAGQQGVQDTVVEGIFAAYFTEGLDVGNLTALANIAQRAGLERHDALAYLNSEEGADKVHAAQDVARRSGISGVPTFVVNGQVLFSGALPPEIMLERLLGTKFSPVQQQSLPARLVGG